MPPEQPAKSGPEQGAERAPLSPAKRKRLQQCFERASSLTAKGDYDYATELLTMCVLGDPANLIYAQSFLGNLQKKYNNNKKGSKLAFLKGGGTRGLLKSASMRKDWPTVLKHGLELLVLNPWDVNALLALAEAAEALGGEETQLFYLRSALDANPSDPDVNRLCAHALRERRQYDQAIACWNRVLKARPNDPEALRAVADLTVEKTISHGGYEEAETTRQVRPDKDEPHRREPTPEERLLKEIAKNPKEVGNYLDLAEMYAREERFEEAEKLLTRALETGQETAQIRERLDDLQVRALRNRIAHLGDGKENEKERLELQRKLNDREIEIFEARVQQQPNNLHYKYELADRLVRAGRYKDAIQPFQAALRDPRHKGACLLALGYCFQQIKQYRLAMTHFEQAIQEIPDRDSDAKKLALFRAGRLALALKKVDAAEQHLSALAAMDFGYRDVAALLDKVATLRDNGGLAPE